MVQEKEMNLASSQLAGQLMDFLLPDIVQLVALGKKTGELRLRAATEQKNGSLYFEQGKIIHAVSGEKNGETALLEIAGWNNASFSFLTDQLSDKRTMEKPAVQALLEALHKHDELAQLKQKMPADDTRLFISSEIESIPTITPEQWRLLSLVNGRRTIASICQVYGHELEARKLLAELLEAKLLTDKPHSTDWYRLVPKPTGSSEVRGSRSFPTRLRTNLLLKAIDGIKSIFELRIEFNMEEKVLWDELKYLSDEQWIHFETADIKRFYAMEQEL
jgi:hypothetical protein